MSSCDILERNRDLTDRDAPRDSLDEKDWKAIEPPLSEDDEEGLAMIHAMLNDWDNGIGLDG